MDHICLLLNKSTTTLKTARNVLTKKDDVHIRVAGEMSINEAIALVITG
jgi:hypothetical protein